MVSTYAHRPPALWDHTGPFHFESAQLAYWLPLLMPGAVTVKLGYYVPSREMKNGTGVVTKVRSIQNAIFLTGRTGSTCSRERSATEDASPSWMLFIIRFSFGEIAFQGIVNLKTCREIEIEPERLDDMLAIRKKNQRKGKKVLLAGKLVGDIRFCATFCTSTSYLKKKGMFTDWRCPWSTERTL